MGQRGVKFRGRALAQSSSGVVISLEATSLFFDRPAVQRMIGRRKAKALSRLGAFIRQAARTTVLRRRKKAAPPGQPPSVHSKDQFATLKNIRFAMTSDGEGVLVGPLEIKARHDYGVPDTTPVPSAHEHGRSVAVVQRRRRFDPQAEWMRTWSRPDHARYEYRVAEVQYPVRQFMGPALLLSVKTGKVRQAVGS